MCSRLRGNVAHCKNTRVADTRARPSCTQVVSTVLLEQGIVTHGLKRVQPPLGQLQPSAKPSVPRIRNAWLQIGFLATRRSATCSRNATAERDLQHQVKLICARVKTLLCSKRGEDVLQMMGTRKSSSSAVCLGLNNVQRNVEQPRAAIFSHSERGQRKEGVTGSMT